MRNMPIEVPKHCSVLNLIDRTEEYFQKFECTIDESIKGAASLRRYGITFDDNINIKYKTPPFTYMFFIENCLLKDIFAKPFYAVLPRNEQNK